MSPETTICATCHAEGTGRCSLPRCGWKSPEIVTRLTDDSEIMVTLPSGRVTFMGWWGGIRFVCRAIFHGFKVKVED